MGSVDASINAHRTVGHMLAELKTCSKTQNLERGKQVHADAVEFGHGSNIYVASRLITMYAKCGSMMDAHRVFDSIEHPDVVSWTVLILGYAENGEGRAALGLFTRMKNVGHTPDSVTFVAALRACTSLVDQEGDNARVECKKWGKEIHHMIVKNGCDSNLYVQSTLIDMYAKCGNMVDAQQVFENMKYADVVSWTALILGYAEDGEGSTALELFTRSECPAPDSRMFMAALKACTSLAVKKGASGWVECRHRGKQIYNLAVEKNCGSNAYVQSSLIDMFAKCGSMVEAHNIFDNMEHPNVVSWTALIQGYADMGEGIIALDLFTRMKVRGTAPNSVTFSSAIRACTVLGALELGRTIHTEIEGGCHIDVVLLTCLVDFYAKCGSLTEAEYVFDLHADIRDMITWNALLGGFCNCGDDESVFALFERMQDAGFQPNGVTFLCILTCCSHSGLVERGRECFDTMTTRYGIIPALEHYSCMMGMFGRANQLDDAMALLQLMPCSADEVTWMTILGACCKHKNVGMGRLAFQSLIYFNDKDSAVYMLMGQIYGNRGMLQEQELVMGMKPIF